MGNNHRTLLELVGVVKEFPGVKALNGVSFSVREGEIHALVGENGAGKSTLIKIMAGLWPHGTFSGKLVFDSREMQFRSVRDARSQGIAVIHQELALVPEMTVAENICLGDEKTRFGWIDNTCDFQKAALALQSLDVRIDPRELVARLGTGAREIVEIAKALSQNFRVLILDEPTAALSDKETQQLFKLLKNLKRKGVGLVYISHRLKEVYDIADRITVLRDGMSIATVLPKESDENQLIRLMVGRELKQVFPPKPTERLKSNERLRVEGLKIDLSERPTDDLSQTLNFTLHEGEILGIAGLVGSGRTTLLESLFGLRPKEFLGRVWLNGREV